MTELLSIFRLTNEIYSQSLENNYVVGQILKQGDNVTPITENEVNQFLPGLSAKFVPPDVFGVKFKDGRIFDRLIGWRDQPEVYPTSTLPTWNIVGSPIGGVTVPVEQTSYVRILGENPNPFSDYVPSEYVPTHKLEQSQQTPKYKYNEQALIEEFHKYIDGTYKGHYVGEDNVQSLDLIFAAKAGWGFCQGNVLKYAGPRLGVKNNGDETRADILKVLHYALLMLYLLDKKKEGK